MRPLVLLTAALLVMFAGCGAQARDITITLSDDEQKALVQILDLATKAGGLPTAQATMYFARKIEDAAKQPAPAPAPTPAPPAQ